MNNHQFLNANTEKLIALNSERMASHVCDVTDDDYERIMPKIDLLKQLSSVERSLYAVYDMHKSQYLLKSEEQKKLFGNEGTLQQEDSTNPAIIHPEDLAFKLETDELVYQFYAGLPVDVKKDYKLVYDYRVKNKYGNYLRFIHQSIILELDRNGKAWLLLVISYQLSEKQACEHLQRRMINMKTGKFHLFNDADEGTTKLLTKREWEILNLITQGYDSINISDRLHISINTVNNHRQNILRKTKTENATQAVLFCKRLGII